MLLHLAYRITGTCRVEFVCLPAVLPLLGGREAIHSVKADAIDCDAVFFLDVGFVVTEEGKDSCVFCPYKWFELEYETIEVAVDEVLLAQIKEIITPLGWTVERLIVRFLEWLVDPETQEEAIAWLMKAKEELGEK